MDIRNTIQKLVDACKDHEKNSRITKGVSRYLSRACEHKIQAMLRLVDPQSRPNMTVLNERLRDIDLISLNIKANGYRLARLLAETLPPATHDGPQDIQPGSKLCTQEDIASDWSRYWSSELKLPVVFHRKLWEYTYLLQALHASGNIAPGRVGLGFGCGLEPIASYLASRDVKATITDLPPEHQRVAGWASSNEYVETLEKAHVADLVDREQFIRMVSHRHVDMNAIPDDLSGFDFCWSVCALEHLGSIQQGLDFIEASLRTLRPGGTAVHTTEFNINPEGPTIDNWMTVLFQRKHIEGLVQKLESQGHTVAPLDFSAGSQPMDQFIDIPPWNDDLLGPVMGQLDMRRNANHLKLSVDGFVVTCFAITITKGGS
ncbi:methyltransferase domain-containing protein [Komagataeibacter sp. FXV2]|nr:methyltransferase domain-containing protein [Komagataeibacter sp. FXV2]